MRSIEVPEVADLEGLGADKLELLLVECDTARRQAEAMELGEGFPTADHDRELVEPQRLGVPDQQLTRIRELVGATRVGQQPGE